MTATTTKHGRWTGRAVGAFLLIGALGCGGGGSGAGPGGGGRLSARVFWEQAGNTGSPLASTSGTAPDGGFGAELPAAVTTVRLDFKPSVGAHCCVAVDPSRLSVDPVTGRRSVVLSDIPVGPGALTIAGFPDAVATAPIGTTATCALEPADAAFACDVRSLDTPSFLSNPTSVAVRAGALVNAGDILVPAVPFVLTGRLVPSPGSSIAAPFAVGATVAIASRDLPVDRVTISTTPGGAVPTTLTFCDDATATPCSADGTLQVRGLRADGTRSALPSGNATVEVLATRLDGAPPLRVAYNINVQAAGSPTPSPTNTAIASTRTPLPTATRPEATRPTATRTTSPTRTNRPPATPTVGQPATPTRTHTRRPTEATGSPTATPNARCAPSPAVGCRQSIEGNRSTIILSSPNNPDNARMLFRWERGNFTDRRDFGDPGLTTSYALCLYDQIAGVPTLVTELFLPPGPDCSVGATGCWRVTDDGFRYEDSTGARAGIELIDLAAGLPGRANIRYRAGGRNFDTPQLPFAQNQTVVVQLKNDHEGGQCWEARFSRPATRSDATIFRDAGDSPSNP